jgi:hypothetical protein
VVFIKDKKQGRDHHTCTIWLSEYAFIGCDVVFEILHPLFYMFLAVSKLLSCSVGRTIGGGSHLFYGRGRC